MNYLSEYNIFLFLIQLFLLLGLTRVVGELFRRWRQPPLTAEILVGVLLGPTVFGRFLPSIHQSIFPPDIIQQNMLETIAWLGALFLLLETGLEFNFSSALRQGKDALKIALTDIAIPLLISFLFCFFIPTYYLVDPQKRFIFALFMATVMTITAMPTSVRALHDLKLTKTDLGFLIMSALSINDIIGWLIFTLVLGLFSQSIIGLDRVIFILSATVGFAVICLTIGRGLSNFIISKIRAKQMPEPSTSLTFICLMGILCGAITQKIGIHALFGFFIAGIVVGEAKALSERTRQVISQMVYAIFVPIFFASIGLKIDFLKNFNIFLVASVSVVGISARFFGAWLGASFTKITKVNRLPIAIAHTPGGAMEIIIGIIALQYHLITEPVFVAIVFGATISSIILGPWLNYSISKRKEVDMLEFFSQQAVMAEVKADEKDKAIERLCEIAASQDDTLEAESVYYSVLQRENAMGTAIEEGVAVPHARLSGLERAVIVFGKSAEGIEWNSPDGKPTHFIFLILTPATDDIQVQILSSIAKVMSNKETRDAVMRVQETRQLWHVLHDAFAPHHIVRSVS